MNISCPQCGASRSYRPATIARLKSHVCRKCWLENRRVDNVIMTCPHCGKEREISPWLAKRHIGYCFECPRYIPSNGLPDNYDSGYVLGVVLGDACLTKSKMKNSISYGIRLSVTSEEFAKKFQKHLGACLGRMPWRGTYERDMKANPKIGMPAVRIKEHIVQSSSREWYDMLKPYKKDHNYEGIVDKSDDFRKGFFQGILDSEGYINPKYTDIANKNIALLELVASVLRSLGEQATINGPYSYSRGVAHLRTRADFAKTA